MVDKACFGHVSLKGSLLCSFPRHLSSLLRETARKQHRGSMTMTAPDKHVPPVRWKLGLSSVAVTLGNGAAEREAEPSGRSECVLEKREHRTRPW